MSDLSNLDTAALAPAQERRLIVLDDDVDICATFTLIGRHLGWHVVAVQTSSEFEDAMLSHTPDIIILDLLMAGCDGIEMLSRLQALNCTAGIIISSGVEKRVLEAAGRNAHELGLNLLGTLAKPFSVRTFRALLEGNVPASSNNLGILISANEHSQHLPIHDCANINVSAIDAGLKTKQFQVHYQPKVCCLTGDVEGLEALVRWDHPVLGVLAPEQFLSIVERSMRIEALTNLVVDQSLAWLSNIPEATKLGMAINLSPYLLGDIGLADRIEKSCNNHSIDPARITLEITEASAMEDPVTGLALATRFCMKAFKLSIDDFGVGYSSLVQLARLPFSDLKIDRQFVCDVPNSVENQAIVEATILMAHRLGLSVTAEGVDSAETLSYLASIGCDYAQGFGIAKPMGAAAAVNWVRNRVELSQSSKLEQLIEPTL